MHRFGPSGLIGHGGIIIYIKSSLISAYLSLPICTDYDIGAYRPYIGARPVLRRSASVQPAGNYLYLSLTRAHPGWSRHAWRTTRHHPLLATTRYPDALMTHAGAWPWLALAGKPQFPMGAIGVRGARGDRPRLGGCVYVYSPHPRIFALKSSFTFAQHPRIMPRCIARARPLHG